MTTQMFTGTRPESISAPNNEPNLSSRAAASIVYRALSFQQDQLYARYDAEVVDETTQYALRALQIQLGPEDPEKAYDQMQETALEWAARAPRNEASIEDDPDKPRGLWRFSPCRQLVELLDEDIRDRSLFAEDLPDVTGQHQAIMDRAILLHAGSELDQTYGNEALDYAQSIGLIDVDHPILHVA